MAAPVMRDATEPTRSKVKDLVIPIIRAQRPSVTENDRLSFANVLVKDIRTVLCFDKAHRDLPFLFSCVDVIIIHKPNKYH
jgi:hypothetical protein